MNSRKEGDKLLVYCIGLDLLLSLGRCGRGTCNDERHCSINALRLLYTTSLSIHFYSSPFSVGIVSLFVVDDFLCFRRRVDLCRLTESVTSPMIFCSPSIALSSLTPPAASVTAGLRVFFFFTLNGFGSFGPFFFFFTLPSSSSPLRFLFDPSNPPNFSLSSTSRLSKLAGLGGSIIITARRIYTIGTPGICLISPRSRSS